MLMYLVYICTGKGDGPDLKSFIQQLPVASEGKVLIIFLAYGIFQPIHL